MINLLITIVILAIVGGLVYYLLMMLPIPEPFKKIVQICAILIGVLLLVGVLFGGVSLPYMRL